ncbi:FUSC family protein, partial [Nonomuraea sp. NPDC050405]|uniref:FUSC family protein n=1 Tax=Nonomuraea sp. NPDC050405 TaxID=3154509 RepID=UPI0033C9D3BB
RRAEACPPGRRPHAWPFALLVAALAALRPPLKDRRPAAYAAVMTPLVLLLSGGASAGMAGHRIADTAIGCAPARGLGYLPWAVRRRRNPVRTPKEAVRSPGDAARSREDAVQSRQNAVQSQDDRAESRPDDVRSARAVVE